MASIELYVDEKVKSDLSSMDTCIAKLQLVLDEVEALKLPTNHLKNAIHSIEKARSKKFTELVIGIKNESDK